MEQAKLEIEKQALDGNYKACLKRLSNLEVESSTFGGFIIHNDKWDMDMYYSVYLMIFLFLNDLNGAKYLWKRAPDSLKMPEVNTQSYSRFSIIWQIVMSLLGNEYSQALQILKDIISNRMMIMSDSIVLLALSERLQNALENHLIYSISNTYDTISTVSLKKYFCISDEEIVNFTAKYNWKVDETSQVVYPSTVFTSSRIEDTERSFIQDCSEHIAFLQKRPITSEFLKTRKEELAEVV